MSSNSPEFLLHVRTVTGLEPCLARELEALGAKAIETRNRLVICRGNLELMYQANLWCRTAIRVLRPIASFAAKEEKALYDGIKKINWQTWMSAHGTLAVDADVRSSFTTHSLYLSQLAKDAVVDQFREVTGQRPSVDLKNPDLRIVVSLFEDQAQIYVDASGDSLHKRGYRRRAGEAPLSEVLAAGIVQLSDWKPGTPLFDAMCGSGTMAIEAALVAKNIAPGAMGREFGFQKWPDYDRALFESLLAKAHAAETSGAGTAIFALDQDAEVLEVARENAARARVSDLIRFEPGDFFETDPPVPTAGVLVMNPPYDERLPVDNIAELCQRIGDRLKQAYGGWSASLLCGNLEATKYLGLRTSRRTILYNGSIECRLLKYELRAKAPGTDTAPQAPAWRTKSPEENPKWKERAEVFANRLRKNLKNYANWAKREEISCWRVYDWDIPELPFLIDIYGDRLHVAEIERNYDHSPVEHTAYIQMMVRTAAQVLGVEASHVYFKKRKPQKAGGFQYSAVDERGELIEVTEGGLSFWVNLADYLDTGLFLDHRKTRAMVRKVVAGKDFLNLFAYTGSFTVYAAAGGAKSTTTVDTSSTYLEWAEENLKLNGFSGSKHQLFRSDVLEYLQRTRQSFDVCVVDPPTRSVNRSSGRTFDVQADHVNLLQLVLDRLRPGGVVYFSNNYRTFQMDEAALKQGRAIQIQEITKKTIPYDFERKPSHRCWLITLA